MNKEKRAPYLFLANFPMEGWGLCNWCKYALWDGYSCCAELTCTHPLPVINGAHPDHVWSEGADCWGFRPKATLQVMGIVASIRVQGYIARRNDKTNEWEAITPSKRDREELQVFSPPAHKEE